MSPIDFFGNHIYRMVLFGTMITGLVAGALGSFAYLRRQSLISDVISHSALSGTLLAFLAMTVIWHADGRALPALILGAVIAGTLAVASANGVAAGSRIRIDTAMGVTLTTFFGAGMVLMRVIANGRFPGKGGIQDYLFGNASVITRADLVTTGILGGVAVIMIVGCWKEFALRTFDPDQAAVLGFGGRLIDGLMFAAIVVATVIGVKSVGLVLMVALVISPPAAARQWTHTLPAMVALSAIIGAVASGIGAYLSVLLGKVPTGPLIVLTLFAIMVCSLLFAPQRSVLVRLARHRRIRARLRTTALDEATTGTGAR